MNESLKFIPTLLVATGTFTPDFTCTPYYHAHGTTAEGPSVCVWKKI